MLRRDLAQALGVNAATVTRDAAAGMPTHSVEAARQWRLENRRARVAPPPRRGEPPEGAVAAGPAQVASGDEPANPDDYWASRARREKAEADLAELKLAEQKGELIRTADVRAAYARRAAGLREALLQIPSRLAAVLAAETDMARCHDVIQSELHQVLAQLTVEA